MCDQDKKQGQQRTLRGYPTNFLPESLQLYVALAGLLTHPCCYILPATSAVDFRW